MKISREELKELNKKGRVEVWNITAGKGYWEILELTEGYNGNST